MSIEKKTEHTGHKDPPEQNSVKPQDSPAGVVPDSPTDDKFVPTCAVCGQKHWPFHHSVPCINLKQAKVKAQADEIIVSAETHQELGNRFQSEKLPPVRVKGKSAEIHIFKIRGFA